MSAMRAQKRKEAEKRNANTSLENTKWFRKLSLEAKKEILSQKTAMS